MKKVMLLFLFTVMTVCAFSQISSNEKKLVIGLQALDQGKVIQEYVDPNWVDLVDPTATTLWTKLQANVKMRIKPEIVVQVGQRCIGVKNDLRMMGILAEYDDQQSDPYRLVNELGNDIGWAKLVLSVQEYYNILESSQ